jgi:hypothetical protein
VEETTEQAERQEIGSARERRTMETSDDTSTSNTPEKSPGSARGSSDIDDLLDLFNQTIRSLANDAAAVRQMTSLADVLEDASAAGNNKNGGIAKSNLDTPRSSALSLESQLYDVARIIGIMEGKVEELKDIVNHEKDAILFFETTLQQEAEDQERVIKSIEEAISKSKKPSMTREITVDRTSGSGSSSSSSDFLSSMTKRASLLQIQENMSSTNRVATPGMKQSCSGKNNIAMSNHGNNNGSVEGFEKIDDDEEYDDEELKFERITASEMEDHNRHSVSFGMSRISRMDLNEALEEIEGVVQNKIKLSSLNHKKVSQDLHRRSSSNQDQSYVTTSSLQRRFDYLQQRHQRAAPRDLLASTLSKTTDGGVDTTAKNNDCTMTTCPVSEQELRENCAFFRHGESTARATLSVLCSMKRLRQIPVKSKEDITYVCLFRSTDTTGQHHHQQSLPSLTKIH